MKRITKEDIRIIKAGAGSFFYEFLPSGGKAWCSYYDVTPESDAPDWVGTDNYHALKEAIEDYKKGKSWNTEANEYV